MTKKKKQIDQRKYQKNDEKVEKYFFSNSGK